MLPAVFTPALAATPPEVSSTEQAGTHNAADVRNAAEVRILTVGRGGALTPDGKDLNDNELRQAPQSNIIYLRATIGTPYDDFKKALERVQAIPNSRVFLLTEDAKAAQ